MKEMKERDDEHSFLKTRVETLTHKNSELEEENGALKTQVAKYKHMFEESLDIISKK